MDHDQALFRLFGKYCPEGTIIANEGTPGDEMLLIRSGAVRVGGARQHERSGATLVAGEVLGEEAFFARAPRVLRAEAAQDTRLLQVNDRNLEAVVRHGPEEAFGMLQKLFALAAAARRDLDAWILTAVLRRAEPSLLAFGAAGFTGDELAEQTGLEAADAVRLLLALERTGGVVRTGPTFRIPDPERFARAAHALFAAGSGP